MRGASTKRGAAKPKDGPLKETWSQIAKDEEGVLNAVTKVVERVPAPADVIDSALAFAARMLKAQREALVPLLEGVTPKPPGSVPSAADAVASAYGLAERILESQRKSLRGLVETVTPPLAKHAAKPAAAKASKRATVARPGARRAPASPRPTAATDGVARTAS